jgi:lysozyme
MKPKTKTKKRRVSLLAVFVCVILGFAFLWGVAALLEKITHYGNTATVSASRTSQSAASSSASTGLIPGLPLSSYDATAFTTENGFVRYTGADASAQLGVDVSAYQKDIDWKKVAAAGVQFAMIKVGYRGYTEGSIQADEYFDKNMQGALDAGLKVGVYFFSQAISIAEAKEEADYVLEKIKSYTVTCPVVFDWENIEDQARSDGVDSILLTACAKAFCEKIEQAGYKPGVYFNQQYGYQEFNLPSLTAYDFWLAEYAVPPTFVYDFQLWQYTNEGSVDGIDGNVDVNLMFTKK